MSGTSNGVRRSAPGSLRHPAGAQCPCAQQWRNVSAISMGWRMRLGSPALALALVFLASNACIGNRPRRCEAQSDCLAQGAVCSTRGYCEKECSTSEDCPCGSYCAEGCGLCIRADNTGAATCFPSDNGLTVNETLGVCRPSLKPPLEQRSDAGACIVPLPPLMCTERVSRSVLLDAGSSREPPQPAPSTPPPPPAPEPPDAGDASVDAEGSP